MKKLPGYALIAAVLLAAVLGAVFTLNSAPAKAAPLFRLAETNGNYAVGWTSSGEGDAVKEISGGYRLNFNPTTTYQGLAAGTINFTNGTYMATTADCTGVIQKGFPSENGTVWAEKFDGNGHVWMINRYCDGSVADHPGDIALAGRNNGTQFSVCGSPFDCSGWYSKMTER